MAEVNSIVEGRQRFLAPDADGVIEPVSNKAIGDLRAEVEETLALKAAGQGAEARARSSIESRTDLRLAAAIEVAAADPQRSRTAPLALPVGEDLARQWSDLDASDFGRLRSTERKEKALESIAAHVRQCPEYAAALKERAPALTEAAGKLNAALAQEEVKRVKEAAALERQALTQAQSAARRAVIDADALARVAKVRASQTAEVSAQIGPVAMPDPCPRPRNLSISLRQRRTRTKPLGAY